MKGPNLTRDQRSRYRQWLATCLRISNWVPPRSFRLMRALKCSAWEDEKSMAGHQRFTITGGDHTTWPQLKRDLKSFCKGGRRVIGVFMDDEGYCRAILERIPMDPACWI